MKLIFDFDEIIKKIDYITSVVEDNQGEDTMKNIVFYVTKNDVKLVGRNNSIICKSKLEYAEVYDMEEEEIFWQLRCKEFSGYLKSLVGMKRTKVSEIHLQSVGNGIRLTVKEEAISEDIEFAEKLNRTSHWLYENRKIGRAELEKIKTDITGVSYESVISKDVRLYLDALSGVLEGKATDNSNKIYFREDLVYTLSNKQSIAFENTLPKQFQNMSLNAQGVKFLNKILVGNEIVDVARNDNFLIISTDSIEVYMAYNKGVYDLSKQLSRIARKDENGVPMEYERPTGEIRRLTFLDNQHAIIIDKTYLLDVLKRFNILEESILLEIDVENACVKLRNSKMDIEIPFLNQKNMDELNGIKFKTDYSRMKSVLVDNEAMFTTDVFMYFIKMERGYTLVSTDSTAFWFSMMSVN